MAAKRQAIATRKRGGSTGRPSTSRCVDRRWAFAVKACALLHSRIAIYADRDEWRNQLPASPAPAPAPSSKQRIPSSRVSVQLNVKRRGRVAVHLSTYTIAASTTRATAAASSPARGPSTDLAIKSSRSLSPPINRQPPSPPSPPQQQMMRVRVRSPSPPLSTWKPPKLKPATKREAPGIWGEPHQLPAGSSKQQPQEEHDPTTDAGEGVEEKPWRWKSPQVTGRTSSRSSSAPSSRQQARSARVDTRRPATSTSSGSSSKTARAATPPPPPPKRSPPAAAPATPPPSQRPPPPPAYKREISRRKPRPPSHRTKPAAAPSPAGASTSPPPKVLSESEKILTHCAVCAAPPPNGLGKHSLGCEAAAFCTIAAKRMAHGHAHTLTELRQDGPTAEREDISERDGGRGGRRAQRV